MASKLAQLARQAMNFLGRRTASGGGTAQRSAGGLGRLASQADRRARHRRLPDRVTGTAQGPPPVSPELFLQQLERMARGERLSPTEARAMDEALAAPPPGVSEPVTAELVSPPPPPPPGDIAAGDEDGDEVYDPIEIAPRVEAGDIPNLREHEVESSNVYSYRYMPESEHMGNLIVTFLGGEGKERKGPGPTYAYYSVTPSEYRAFRRSADQSAGGAVWDHLRVRGTIWGHQKRYRLISVAGEYIPRRATQRGFRTRYLAPPNYTARERMGRVREPGRPRQDAEGYGTRLSPEARRELRRRGFRRSTLEEELATADRGYPDRGYPDRG